jgi:hypothetical protein
MTKPTILSTPVLPCGSDEHGLICGFRFAPGEPVQPIDAISEAGLAPLQDGFVWLRWPGITRASGSWWA